MSCRLPALAVSLLMLFPAAADMTGRPAVRDFIEEMTSQHGFDQRQLQAMFSGISSNSRVIELISKPAEKKPWHKYRPIFVNLARIRGGESFMKRHADALRRAEEQYGVPMEIIVSIIGVETNYGGNTGSFNVVRALATLAFDYPPRSEFFRGELRHLLLLAREQGIDPTGLEGSYAGAMGLPQFISSSYRSYAVDFDGDGAVNIWDSYADAIGSVANYLRENGWQREQSVIAREVDGGSELHHLLAADGGMSSVSAELLAAHGIATPGPVAAARVVSLENRRGTEYWLAFPNFQSITTYNRSDLYAMAVFLLSEEFAR